MLALAQETGHRRSAWKVATAAMLLAAAWLGLNVAGNYDGQWSGLFYTGSKAPLPETLGAHIQRVPDEIGYDAQFYHLIAHDPLIQRDFIPYVDNPRLRWRRIGVPGLAALLTAGSDHYVDAAYIAIQLGLVLLGVYWLSRYAQEYGLHAAWGVTFLLIPAVLVSLDRMTIDLPLAALCVGLIWYAARIEQANHSARWPVYVILAAAPLVRETGMILVAAWCAYSALRRNLLAAALGACCAIPALAWWAYVHSRTPPDGTPWLSTYPFSGIIERTVHGIGHPTSSPWLRMAANLETAAIAGIWLALLLTFYLAWRLTLERRWELAALTAILFAVFSASLGRLDIWASAYATGRTMSPLLIMLGLLALRERRWLFALPLLLVLPRIALQYQAQLKGALRGIL
ncbi:MAG TPA: hypothetical protein VM616_02825 [Gammaproteobacteria bacterium]|nr:hypothetical protein [Gammaproteobacteria bacterium]